MKLNIKGKYLNGHLHFHGRQHRDHLTFLHRFAHFDLDVDHVAFHGCSELTVDGRIGFGPDGQSAAFHRLVADEDGPQLAVQLEEDLAFAVGRQIGRTGQRLEMQRLSLLDRHLELLGNLGTDQKVARVDLELLGNLGTDQKVARVELVHRPVLLAVVEKVLGHLGVQSGAHHVGFRHVLELLLQLRLQGVEVEGVHVGARPVVDPGQVLQHVAPERLGESAVRLSDLSLQELDDGVGEGQLGGLVQDVLLAQLVLGHVLSQIAHDLGTGRHLDDVPQDLVGVAITPLDVLELITQSQAVRLELQVGVLAAGDLVLIHVRVARPHGARAFERSVQRSRLLPKSGILAHFVQVQLFF